MTTPNQKDQLWKSLEDPEYRHQFVEEGINVGIAFQIRALRTRQGLTQKRLADKLTTGQQPAVSSWENPNYGNYTLKTLKDLAKAFDVGLLVRFVPFSELVDRTARLTHDAIAPPSFGEEQKAQMPLPDGASETPTNKDIANFLRKPTTADQNPYDLITNEEVPYAAGV
jgi:transcriptional regulator with XRE-family HTH domain